MNKQEVIKHRTYDYSSLDEEFIISMLAKCFLKSDIVHVLNSNQPHRTKPLECSIFAQIRKIKNHERMKYRDRVNGVRYRENDRDAQQLLTKNWRLKNKEKIAKDKLDDKKEHHRIVNISISSNTYYARWTKEETHKLFQGILDDLTWNEIALSLSRSSAGCIKRTVNTLGTRDKLEAKNILLQKGY